MLFWAAAPRTLAVCITGADLEGRAQFKFETAGATCCFDRAGGGFSRLIDRDGRDWISFKRDPLTGTRAAAGAGYRGIPIMLFGKDNPDAGAGHPGHDQCESTVKVIGEISVIRGQEWSEDFLAGSIRRLTARIARFKVRGDSGAPRRGCRLAARYLFHHGETLFRHG